ncbi:MAG: LysR family transcriptional regulator [Myxococcota bacterium]
MLAWDDLRFVLALSRAGTASGAARELDVNATTVTRRLQALEEQLGVTLFERRATGMVPTDAGAAAVRAAQQVEESVLRLDAEIHGLDRALRGSLRISTMDLVLELWRDAFATFHREHPGISLSLTSSALPVDLSRREADVAIRFSTAPPEQLVGRRLAEVFYAVYGSRALIDQVRAKTPEPGYADFDWISWDEPFSFSTDSVVERYALGASIRLRVNAMGTLTRCLEDGLGISVLPCMVGDRNPALVRLGSYFEGGLYLWVLTHEQLRRAARVRAMMNLVTELVEQDEDLIMGRTPLHEPIPMRGDTR